MRDGKLVELQALSETKDLRHYTKMGWYGPTTREFTSEYCQASNRNYNTKQIDSLFQSTQTFNEILQMSAIPYRSPKNKKIAIKLEQQYQLMVDLSKIEEFTTIDTPDGKQMMVKYDRRWYLLGDF